MTIRELLAVVILTRKYRDERLAMAKRINAATVVLYFLDAQYRLSIGSQK